LKTINHGANSFERIVGDLLAQDLAGALLTTHDYGAEQSIIFVLGDDDV
jgi:hypothetical protein